MQTLPVLTSIWTQKHFLTQALWIQGNAESGLEYNKLFLTPAEKIPTFFSYGRLVTRRKEVVRSVTLLTLFQIPPMFLATVHFGQLQWMYKRIGKCQMDACHTLEKTWILMLSPLKCIFGRNGLEVVSGVTFWDCYLAFKSETVSWWGSKSEQKAGRLEFLPLSLLLWNKTRNSVSFW